MKHKTLEAKAVATDRGDFTAIAAAYSVDRVRDQIVPGAFAKTIAAWQASGKRLPLHYDHKGDPQFIIGSVDPMKMQEVDEGLYIEGNIDLKGSEVGREAWRVMKTDAMSLSFGYLETKTKKRNGVKELLELDLFEITVTPAPVQADTRFLSLKSAQAALESEATEPTEDDSTDTEPEPLDPRELRKRTFNVAHDISKSHPVVRKAGPVEEPPDESEEVEPDGAEVPSPPEVTIEEGAITAPIVTPEKATTVHTVKGGVHTVTQVSAVEDGSTEEPKVEEPEAKVAPQDPLRKRTYEVALGISNGGMRVRKYIEPEPDPEPLDAAALRRRSDELALDIARG